MVRVKTLKGLGRNLSLFDYFPLLVVVILSILSFVYEYSTVVIDYSDNDDVPVEEDEDEAAAVVLRAYTSSHSFLTSDFNVSSVD